MSSFLESSAFFGVAVSLVAYGLGCLLQKKWKCPLFNPLLISIIITIALLAVSNMDYDVYYSGAKYLSYLLTPATVCLAIPLYEKLDLLKQNKAAILLGIASGVLTTLLCVLAMGLIFGLNHAEYVTLLPKSITTAIGMGVSEELGGYVTLTVAVIIITGLMGNMFAPMVCRVFHITDPIAKGIAIGTSSHAVGTAKAMEMGQVEGAMSSLSIAVAGILTVVGASVFVQFICIQHRRRRLVPAAILLFQERCQNHLLLLHAHFVIKSSGIAVFAQGHQLHTVCPLRLCPLTRSLIQSRPNAAASCFRTHI